MYKNKVYIKISCLLLVMIFFSLFISDYSNHNSSIDDNPSAESSSFPIGFGKFIFNNLGILNSSLVSIRTSFLTIYSGGRRCSKYLKLRMNTVYSSFNNPYSMHNSRINKINLERSLIIKDCNIKINIDWINLKNGKKKISLL